VNVSVGQISSVPVVRKIQKMANILRKQACCEVGLVYCIVNVCNKFGQVMFTLCTELVLIGR